MHSFAAFAGLVVGSVVDPLALVGYILAGAVGRRWFYVMAIAIVWAVVIEVIVAQQHASLGMEHNYELLVPRIIGALLVSFASFGIARLIRSKLA